MNRLLVVVIFIIPLAATAADQSSVCEALVSERNMGLEWIANRKHPDMLAYEKIKSDAHDLILKNNSNQYFDYVSEYYKIDINNDGALENVVIVGQGSAHSKGVMVLDEKWKVLEFSTLSSDESDCLGASQRIVKFRDRYYVVDSCKESMNYAFMYDKKQLVTVCTFDYETQPTEVITKSLDDNLCHAGVDKKLNYVSFTEAHTLDYGCHDSEGPECAHPLPMVAKVDIDNNGAPDLVVRMGVAWGGGAGCDFESLDILGDSRKDVVKTESADLLRKATQKWGICGNATSLPFIFNGQVYVENKYNEQWPSNYHNIIQLKGGKIITVCEFSAKRRVVIRN